MYDQHDKNKRQCKEKAVQEANKLFSGVLVKCTVQCEYHLHDTWGNTVYFINHDHKYKIYQIRNKDVHFVLFHHIQTFFQPVNHNTNLCWQLTNNICMILWCHHCLHISKQIANYIWILK